MLELISAMAIVLSTWALWIATLIGWGLIVRRALGGRGRWGWPGWWGGIEGDELHTCFWLGFASVVALLQLWHLARPIDHLAMTLVLAVGIVGVIAHGRVLARALTPTPAVAATLALVALWLANRAIGPGDAHDSGLYHYATLQWQAAYPIVPGLANLMPTLALNHAGLLYATLLDLGPWHERAQHFVNGSLLLPVVARVAVAAQRLVRARSPRPALDVYYIILIPMLAGVAFSKAISSPTTDPAIGLVSFVVIAELLRLAMSTDWPQPRLRFAVVSITALCALLVCLKLSAAILALGLWIVAVALYLRRSSTPATAASPTSARTRVATLALVVIVSTLLVGPWMARNVILSGYAMYPSTVIAPPVDWRLPEDRLQPLTDAIHMHVKGGLALWISERVQSTPLAWYGDLIDPPYTSRDQIEGWEWVRPWAIALPVSSFVQVVLPAGVALVAGVVGLVGVLRRWRGRRTGDDEPPRPGILRAATGPLVVIAVALVAWFLLGPGPRYAWPMTWPLAAIVTAAAVVATARRSPPAADHTDAVASGDLPGHAISRRAAVATIAFALALVLPVYAYRAGVEWVQRDEPPWALLVQGPGDDDGFHRIPEIEYDTFTTRHGLTLATPVAGVRCWRGPLLCAAWLPLESDLRLRRPGELRYGFVTDRE
ncbi:MAG: hypothetical protein WD316_10570 [Phycisphaeraceae bacterium]